MKLVALSVLLLAGCTTDTAPIHSIKLPPGITEVHKEWPIPEGAQDVEVIGDGSTLHAAGDFHGRAIFAVKSGAHIRFRRFTIDGNRDALEQRVGLPGSNTPFRNFTVNNGILIEGVTDVKISDVTFRQVAGFAILVSGSKQVRIERVRIEDSGSRNAAGRNNTTGGILLEEGTSNFQVIDCEIKQVRGNGVWTHSLYTSPRNEKGMIRLNHFTAIGRDAIQVGHATGIHVENNSGERIGYPESEVDAIPVAIDTAGNVDHATYIGNKFSEINGKCIDLDGFHDGRVIGNVCTNQRNFGIVMNNSNPDMQSSEITIEDNTIDGGQYGGIFVIGGPNKILKNTLRNLNLSHSEDDLLRSGIYLGKGAERPGIARGNLVEGNDVSGYQLKCIANAPEVSMTENRVRKNTCQP
jgi:parallel beta-helix repeat protein